MDNVCRRDRDGCRHARWRHVPAMAPHYAVGCLVPQYRGIRSHWAVLRRCGREVDILYRHCHRCKSWYLDIPEVICGRWICEFSLAFILHLSYSLLYSSILFPLWVACTDLRYQSRLNHSSLCGSGTYPRKRARRNAPKSQAKAKARNELPVLRHRRTAVHIQKSGSTDPSRGMAVQSRRVGLHE